VRTAEDLLDELDIEEAIRRAASQTGTLFPGGLEANAALHDPAAFAKWLRARLRGEWRLVPPEVVFAPRGALGLRPAMDVPFAERVLLAALALRLETLSAESALDLAAGPAIAPEEPPAASTNVHHLQIRRLSSSPSPMWRPSMTRLITRSCRRRLSI
jgi:hypothetical protein